MHIRHGVPNVLPLGLSLSFIYVFICVYIRLHHLKCFLGSIEIRCLMGPVKTAALLGYKPFLGLSTPFNCWHYC